MTAAAPTPNSPSSTPTATSSTPESGTATTVPTQAPVEKQSDDSAGDASTLGTVALFAGVIGVVIGWFLKEVSAWVKGRADAKEKRLVEERSRVVEFVHVAETVAATANGLGTAHAAAASGRPADADQVRDLTTRYNDAQLSLDRLRLEIVIVGPSWAGDLAKDTVQKSLSLQHALVTAEREKSKDAYARLLTEIEAFRDQRSSVVKAAKKQYLPA